MDEQNIPIDINSNKLLEWLISRRHVNKDWQNHIIDIRTKINAAIQDMPVHDGIVKLLSGQHINYFHCVKIVEILKETEADSKNLFGRYGSQRMKDWQDIISSYQKDNLYLAEAAQMLIRNVNFEVPSLRKQIVKHEQLQTDCEKKIKDYTRAETIAANEFSASCKQLGISGENIKKELVDLLTDLPRLYKKLADSVKSVKPALEIYSSFLKFHASQQFEMNVLPLLSYLVENGNTTTYEYTYGETPVTIEEPPLNITVDDSNNDGKTDEINFDVDIDSNEIDFGEVNTDSLDLSGDIDWGNGNTDEEFEIVEHVDLDINLHESGIVVEHSGIDGGIARGTDAYTLLDNPKTRDQIINDLMELGAFLQMRLYEMSTGDNDLLSLSQLDAPTLLQMQTLESITTSRDLVQIALNELTDKRVQHLHNIKHSNKYVDLLTASLRQKLEVAARMKRSKDLLEVRIGENVRESASIEPVIVNAIEKTKLLQREIELDVSRKYKGRKVNVVGGVNMM